MNFLGTTKIESRILEIKCILADKNREKEMAAGITMPIFKGRLAEANRPLLEELDELKIRRQFIHDNRQLLVNLLSIVIALIIAFFGRP